MDPNDFLTFGLSFYNDDDEGIMPDREALSLLESNDVDLNRRVFDDYYYYYEQQQQIATTSNIDQVYLVRQQHRAERRVHVHPYARPSSSISDVLSLIIEENNNNMCIFNQNAGVPVVPEGNATTETDQQVQEVSAPIPMVAPIDEGFVPEIQEIDLGNLNRTSFNNHQDRLCESACALADAGDRASALQTMRELIFENADFVVRKMLNLLLNDKLKKWASFSSRNKGFLRALGRGSLFIEHLERNPTIGVCGSLLRHLRDDCAPRTSKRIPSSKGSTLHDSLQCPLPTMADLDTHWIRLMPERLCAPFYREVTERLPGEWIKCYFPAEHL